MQLSKIRTLSFRTKLIFIVILIATGLFLFNLFTYKYQASSYITFNDLLIILPAYLLYIFSKNIKQSHPSVSFALEGFWSIILVSFVINYFTITIQYTPFKLQDALLQQWDLWIGFNVITVVNWFYQWPAFIFLIKVAYSTNITQLMFIPLFLAILQQRRRLDVFLNATLLSFIIGFLIYYFFPTSDPAHILVNPHFTKQMYSVPARFYDIQHYIPNDDLSGGIIGFPSFHTIWAITAAYSLKNYKIVFYPLIVWNSLIIIATLALGWHFLVDTIAGVVIVIFSILIAEKQSKQQDYPLKAMLALYKRELIK